MTKTKKPVPKPRFPKWGAFGLKEVAACLAVFAAFPALVWGIGFSQGAHGSKALMPKGCGSCHVGHGKRQTPMLPAAEEELCYECHGGPARAERARNEKRLREKAAMRDISQEFRKPSHHPVEVSGAHSPREQTGVPVSTPRRHAECVDCHHHHRTERKEPALGPGPVNMKRSSLDRSEFEYRLCYRCHGRESFSAPFGESTDPEDEFDLGNPSFHPVEGRGTNTSAPSLITPWNEESVISCTDCHNNDNPTGPRGPHGSIYDPILIKYFNQEDDSPESEFQYGLCYSCHARSSVVNDRSFSKHRLHIVEERTSCHTCHDSHGSRTSTHLISFNPEVVSPSSSGRLEFVDMGILAGQCYLSCHGKDHDPLSYP